MRPALEELLTLRRNSRVTGWFQLGWRGRSFWESMRSHGCTTAMEAHPTIAGTYLAACVFLAVLLRVNPLTVDEVPDGLEEKDARVIQAVAAEFFCR